MKSMLALWGLFLPFFLSAQAGTHPVVKADSLPVSSGVQTGANEGKPEVFTSGFLDVLNSGQINASARLIRLYIGEPGRFAIPVSFYSGVSSNNFQPVIQAIPASNELLYTQFINPLSGLANLSAEGTIRLGKQKQTTGASVMYQAGERILTGYRTGLPADPQTGRPVNFLNSFGSAGIYIQTGAWERSNQKNKGISWLAWRYIFTYTRSSSLREFLPAITSNGLYTGWSLAWGVEITRLVNIRVVYYKYIKQPEIDYAQPIYQFSFNYTFR